MSTFGPLPDAAALGALIWGRRSDDEQIAAPWRTGGEQVRWFSRGAWALAEISAWKKSNNRSKSPIFWLPDYFCNQSTAPLRQSGATLVFYPVDDRLEPDWRVCQVLAQEAPPDLFVLVHFFGHPAGARDARQFCDRHGSLLIEDAAHVLRPGQGIGEAGDFVLYCPHKLLPLPDGALLLARATQGPSDGVGYAPSEEPMRAPASFGWAAKRAVQKLLPQSVLKARNRRIPDFDTDPTFVSLPNTPALSVGARRLLERVSGDLSRIDDWRRTQASTWQSFTTERLESCGPLYPDGFRSFVPYRYVLRCQSPEVAQRHYDGFRRAGVPVESWPDLPTEVLDNPDRHEQAIALRRTLLFLPVHQSIDAKRSAATIGASFTSGI